MASPRNTLVVLVTAATLGGMTAALAASQSASGARAASAHATAYQRDDGTRRGQVSVTDNGSEHGVGTSVAASTAGGHGSATASARMRNVNLFDGLVTASAVSVTATQDGASGSVSDLVVNGNSKGTVSGRRSYNMGGHGSLVVLGASGRGILGLRATLTSDYKSFPAGSTIKIAYAAASARDAVAPPPPPQPSKPQPSKPQHSRPAPSNPQASPQKPAKAKREKAPHTNALLTSNGYVFPVYGKHSYTDDWGAPRQDTGFHEGNDIFAAAGTPVVAVCKGSLHRVGTKPVPGNRLWVKCDKAGDEFFYGHLSAFADDAHNGAKVGAGQVVGFVGSTGDAEQTPPHLHFEVHPGGGPAVDPYPFLRAWENRRDVPAAAWVKANGATAGQQPGTLVVVRDFLDR